MNIKAFCAILTEVADFERVFGRSNTATDIDAIVARLKPYHRRQLSGFFTVRSTNRESAPPSTEGLSAMKLGRLLQQTSRLLRAAGSNTKAAELEQAADDMATHAGYSAVGVVDLVQEQDEADEQERVAGYIQKLIETERNTAAFEKIVQEVGKLNAQLAIRVAAGYVQGRPTYSSRPKALTAIRNKQYAQERFLHKTGKR